MAGANPTPLKIPRKDTFRGSPILADGIGVGDLSTQSAGEINTMTISDPNVNVGMAIFAIIESSPTAGQMVTSAIAGAGTVIVSIKNTTSSGASAGATQVNYIAR